MKLTQKTKTIIAISAFLVVFIALLLIATFCDLQISKILTKHTLPEGQYITNSFYPAIMEILGSAPVYLLVGCGSTILFLFFFRDQKETWKKCISVIFAVFGILAWKKFLEDTVQYIIEHYALADDPVVHTGSWYGAVIIIMSIMYEAVEILAFNNIKKETMQKLVWLAVIAYITALVPTILINLVIKNPVGRIRYRAMNVHPDDPLYGFAAYTPWYVAKGQWLSKDEMLLIFGSTDALKSFPSGHTSSAATVYALIALPKALGKEKDKKWMLPCLICPIVYAGAVAIGRIMAGAHFMSDVLVGGTMAFVCAVVSMEGFLYKWDNIKSIFRKASSFTEIKKAEQAE